MILFNVNIVSVENLRLERWSCVKIRIVKNNGSIQNAFNKKIYLRNGTAHNAKNKSKKQEVLYQEDFLFKNKIDNLTLLNSIYYIDTLI